MVLSASHCYIIAEISANHNQSLERALALVRAAKYAGADAVKLQTFLPTTSTIECDAEPFRIGSGQWAGETLFSLYQKAYMPWAWHEPLIQEAKKHDIAIFSTAYDPTAVDFLEKLDIPLHKVSSFEVVDIPLLQKIAATGKPVIMSTGMANLAEIDEAVTTLRGGGAGEVILLKCTSAYPAPPEEANLRTIPVLAQIFNCRAGLSDHTLGSAVAVAAVALGATVIEKHFTLSRADGGPDGSFSMEPAEFKQMVQDIRTVEAALGRVSFELSDPEKESRVFRRSLFVVEDMKAGDVFTEKNVRSIRPGHGVPPKYLAQVLGTKAPCDLKKGTPVTGLSRYPIDR